MTSNETSLRARLMRAFGVALMVGSVGACGDGRLWERGVFPPGRGHGSKPATPARCEPARDRAAILKMAGTFDVKFAFEEVEALAPGYVLREPYRTGGTEVVIVLEDRADRVSLQHILLIPVGEGVVQPLKHWRQDWTYEDGELLEFRGRRVWQHRTLAAEQVRCSWSQEVYQVDDGPRYESYGRFSHEPGRSTWTSHETWRPLPRRESSARNDYDVLLAINTHAITDAGWTHGEDNLKWVIDSQAALAREHGLNEYRRVDLENEHVAHEYLAQTGAFWRDVREEWSVLLDHAERLRVDELREGVALHDVLLPLAEELASAEPAERADAIAKTIAPYVTPLDDE
jgi:hypothetical protein